MMKTAHNRTLSEIDFDLIRENIEKLRKQTINPDTEKPFTREQFAKKAGLNLKTVNRWFEKNGNNPDIASLYRICNAYDCDLDYLTGRIDGDNHAEDSAMQYTGLSKEAVKALHNSKDRSPAALAILDAFIRTIDDFENDALGTVLLNRVSDLFRYRQGKQICEDSDNTAIKMETIETDIDGMTIEVDRYPDVLQDSDPYEKNVVLNECNEKIDLIRYHVTQDATKVLDEMLAKYSEQRKLNGFGYDKTMIATPDYLNKIYDPKTKKLRSTE